MRPSLLPGDPILQFPAVRFAATTHSTYRPKNKWHKCEGLDLNVLNLALSDLQTPLPLTEFFPIGQWGLPYSDH